MNNEELKKAVLALTAKGLYVWQIAKLLDITEYQVVKFQGRG